MYSVFLVEDEVIIRDGLKESFPWEQHGFIYVGDAEDGEMALPLIRQTKPDVLITDIRMPFMDGIELSKIVRRELPNTKIIILSGFNDFTYAQEAISIGVEQYLLKPVTKEKLGEVLDETKAKLDEVLAKDSYLEKFSEENQEYEQFSRIRFFDRLITGKMSVSDVYGEAEKLGILFDSTYYNLVLLDFSPMSGAASAPGYSRHMARLSDRLMQYLSCCPEYIVIHSNADTYAIIVKGDEETLSSHTKNLIENVERRCVEYEEINWYLAESGKISRLSEFPAAHSIARKKLSCRYGNPKGHIFTDSDVETMLQGMNAESSISIDQKMISRFLDNASESELDDFMETIFSNQTKEALRSNLFCRFFLMTIYMCVSDYLRSQNRDPGRILDPDIRSKIETTDEDAVEEIVHNMFVATIELRESENRKQSKTQLQDAIRYVDEHFSDVNLNLNQVAEAVNISPSYLSSMFSRENKTTFVEYVTTRRLEEAKKILSTRSEKTQQVAEMVGYKDAHYFSYLFKKTYGMSPKEYRTKEHSL